MKKVKHKLSILIIALFIGSCGNGSLPGPGVDFDRVAMLENYGNNTILPSYKVLQDAVDNLQVATDTFTADPTVTNLTALQDQLKTTRLAWQNANVFQFGPAKSNTLRTSINTYPADTEQINNNIDSGAYTLGTLENRAAAGFPALGYLLHGIGSTQTEIADLYASAANASNRRQYLNDNIAFIKQKVDNTVTAWQAGGGNYIGTFTSKENSGTDVGSSLGMLVNAMVLHFERFIRDGKIGIPAGVRSSGITRPTATEAYYGGYSVDLAIANLKTMKRIVRGAELDGTDGIGIEEYLEALNASDLAGEILTQLDTSSDSLDALSDPLSQQIQDNNEPVIAAFQQLQQAVTLMKADMASVLAVTITFQDNDGD